MPAFAQADCGTPVVAKNIATLLDIILNTIGNCLDTIIVTAYFLCYVRKMIGNQKLCYVCITTKNLVISYIAIIVHSKLDPVRLYAFIYFAFVYIKGWFSTLGVLDLDLYQFVCTLSSNQSTSFQKIIFR